MIRKYYFRDGKIPTKMVSKNKAVYPRLVMLDLRYTINLFFNRGLLEIIKTTEKGRTVNRNNDKSYTDTISILERIRDVWLNPNATDNILYLKESRNNFNAE